MDISASRIVQQIFGIVLSSVGIPRYVHGISSLLVQECSFHLVCKSS